MTFEPVTTDDLENIRFLQPDDWPDITLDFKEYIKYDFCWPVKLVSQSRIVGIGAAIAFEKTGWLAHIIVDVNHRNRGIGGRITSELIRILSGQGIKILLLLATELGYPVYIKAGFRVVGEYLYMKRISEPAALIPSDKIIPFDQEYITSVLELDRTVTGENREELIRSKLGSSLLYVRENTLMGYYIPEVGEGPIIALDDTAGIELMKVKYATAEKAVLPLENRSGQEFLRTNGFDDSGIKGTRMMLGEGINWQPENIFSRIGGNYG